ncbi:hypothetical protein B566_EDAN007684 [Ephemera danica]|nr:hypothetical protein B566_EDAN007684 [Ephemera danica]
MVRFPARVRYMEIFSSFLAFLSKLFAWLQTPTCLALVALALAYHYFTSTFSYWDERGVKFVKPYPVVGSMLSVMTLREHMLDHFQHMYSQHDEEPFVGFFQGRSPALLVRDPELVKNILVKDFTHFVDHGFKDVLARYTTDTIASCAFGINSNALANPDCEFRCMGRELLKMDFWRGIKIFFILFVPEISLRLRLGFMSRELTEYFRTMVRTVTELRAKTGIVRNDFMQLLIELKDKGCLSPEEDEDPGKHIKNNPEESLHSSSASAIKLTEDEVTAQATVFFLAGFETSSSVMSYALLELAVHTDVQRRAQQEIDEVLERHDGNISYQALHEMQYLDWVMQESMRKYPPTVSLIRICTKNYTVPGSNLTIEKGTHIVIPIHAIQNDPKHFDDPTRFDPERFSDKCFKYSKQYVHMPFGEGPRQCIGYRFAKMQTKLGLLAVLRRFEVLLAPGMSYPVTFDPRLPIPQPIGDFWMRLSLRPRHNHIKQDSLRDVFDYWRKRGVKFVKPLPLVGSIGRVVTFREHISEFYCRVYKQFKDDKFVGFYRMRKPVLLFLDPELIKNILIKDFSHFTDHGLKSNTSTDPVQGRNLFMLGGQKWKDMRAKLTPTFTSGCMKSMFPLVLESTTRLEKFVEGIFQLLRMSNTTDEVTAYFRALVGVLSFALFEMARHPELQRTARLHIEEVLERHDGKFTYQSNYTIPGTNVLIDEGTIIEIPTHAIQNDPAHFSDPETFNPTRFYDEKGENQKLFLAFGEGPRHCLAIPIMAMHNDPRHFPEPERFHPERFDTNEQDKNQYVYMPFGEGQRRCIDS